MTDKCVFCGATEHLNIRELGQGGVQIAVCDHCSEVGQQARRVANTLRPLAPYIERAVAKAVPAVVRGVAVLFRR